MSNPARQKGTSWEVALAEYIAANGWPHCERRALGGALDKGDLSGVYLANDEGVCVEAKNCKSLDIPGWLKELEEETKNAKAGTGFVAIKKRGVSDPGEGYAVMKVKDLLELLRRLK